MLLCKAIRQYLLTCKVSRYCLSALHGIMVLHCVFFYVVQIWTSAIFVIYVVKAAVRM